MGHIFLQRFVSQNLIQLYSHCKYDPSPFILALEASKSYWITLLNVVLSIFTWLICTKKTVVCFLSSPLVLLLRPIISVTHIRIPPFVIKKKKKSFLPQLDVRNVGTLLFTKFSVDQTSP